MKPSNEDGSHLLSLWTKFNKAMGFIASFRRKEIYTGANFAHVKGVKCIVGIKYDNDKYSVST